MRVVFFALLMLAAIVDARAETALKSIEVEYESEIVAEMDGTELVAADIKAFLGRVPEEQRSGTLEDVNRATTIYEDLILTRRLAGKAIERGALNEGLLNADLYQIIMVHLAEREMEHHVEARLLDDYGQQARELYLLNSEDHQTSPSYSFTHLLLTTTGRTGEEARQQLKDLRARVDSGDDFEALVAEHSEDPSLPRNNGRFEDIAPSQLDPAFSDALGELAGLEEPVGKISKPVKTRFGWHLIRLDDFSPARQKTFEEVEEQLRKKARSQHRQEIRESYFKDLMPEPIRIRKAALDRLKEQLD